MYLFLQRYYNNLTAATEAVKTGEVTGVLHINRNISALMEFRINNSPQNFDNVTETELDVHLDMSRKSL